MSPAKPQSINVKEARQGFRALVNRAQAGEEIVLLRHGTPVAKLVPPDPSAERLPSLADFRSSLRIAGRPLREQIVEARGGSHYP
ncbi:MAG: type II toxin-antitoxin system prevent-host-death family antitoxin [Acidobacteriota bacterium]